MVAVLNRLKDFISGGGFKERTLESRKTTLIISTIAILMSFFHLYTAAFGLLVGFIQKAVHLTFVFILVFLLFPAGKKSPTNRIPKLDIALALIATSSSIYTIIFYNEWIWRQGAPILNDLIFGTIAIIFVLEAARRCVGIWLPLIAFIFIIYCYVGPWMPGILKHPGYPFWRIVDEMYLTHAGIYGIPLMVSSTFVFLFILFGAFLEKSGVGKWFIDFSCALLGKSRGGPAKVAVIGSAFFGTVSGSSIANVFGTGSFTIPMMKSLGYKPYFAGAVEAVASTGGQLMPPVMGAAAFIMAEILRVKYFDICIYAALPAILYFFAVGMGVHMEALRTGLKGLPDEKIPKKIYVLKRAYLILPLFILILLLMMGLSPLYTAFWGIISVLAVSMVSKENRMNLRDIKDALERGARNALTVASACACAGIIVGAVTLTGLGMTFSLVMSTIAGGNILIALFLTQMACLLLGMGVPTTANYIITASVAAPALINLGIHPIAAHLFVFYFGIIADITPPVALAAYAASGIAKASPFQTGVRASLLALVAFLIPYVFVLHPQLALLNVKTPLDTIIPFFTALLGAVALACGVSGYIFKPTTILERILMLISAFLLIEPGLYTDLIGIIIFILLLIFNKLAVTRKHKPNVF
ncbi:MAG: TRAP transporter permease [Nitrososphaerales archaeon]